LNQKAIFQINTGLESFTGQVVWVQDFESWVMGLIPTQWTGMLYQYIVSWLKIASCPQGLVDTIGRWKNGPAYSN